MPQSEKSPPDPNSKTRRKKDMLELQKLGKLLIELSPSQLATIPIPDVLMDAIKLAHTLKAHEAIRRHLHYVGKIIRELDPEPIQAALKKIKFHSEQRAAQFHQIEELREQLIVGDDSVLQKLLDDYPQGDRQQLRQLIRKAKKDRDSNKNTGGETALFRYLRELLSDTFK